MTAALRDDMTWLPTDETSLLDAAIAYASHGLPVVSVWNVRTVNGEPRCGCGKLDCPSPAKHPIGNGWQKRATTDVDAVRDMRRARPDANIGIAMGGVARLVTVDIDGPKGRASWAAIEEKHGPAPQTLTSQTGRVDGGEHRIFVVPSHLDMKRLGNRAGFSHECVDTRVDNGQVVVAPSVHKSGNRYRWTVRAPVALMPEWLFEELAAPRAGRSSGTHVTAAPASDPAPAPAPTNVTNFAKPYVAKVLANAARDIAGTREGGRNQILFAKACTVFEYCVGERFDHMEAWRTLGAAGVHCGLANAEVEAVLNKAWKQAQITPRQAPPPQLRSVPGCTGGGAPPGPPGDDWEKHLDRTDEGAIRKTLSNVTTILALHPKWRDVIAYDAFGECVVTTKPAPVREQDRPSVHEAGEWADEDSIRTANWISENCMFDVPTSVVDQAVSAVARRRVVHPVRDYLTALEWDGTPRLDRMLEVYFGAANTEYARGVGARWMISAVARIFDPGCQADCTLVLESRTQGVGKSTALEALAGRDWFADTGIVVGEKDSYQALRRKWIYELGELGALKGREVERVKNFLSARTDNFRVSYGRRNRDFHRQVIFAGTTNESHYLVDKTGNRRFWPVRVTAINVSALRRDRDQLWAEARARYERKEPWHVDTPHFRALCEAEQAERVQDDPWDELINEWLSQSTVAVVDVGTGQLSATRRINPRTAGVTTGHVLIGALRMKPAEITRSQETRVGEVLRSIGWEPRLQQTGGSRVRRYFPRPEPASVQSAPSGLCTVDHQVDHTQTPQSIDVSRGDQPDQPIAAISPEKRSEPGIYGGAQPCIEVDRLITSPEVRATPTERGDQPPENQADQRSFADDIEDLGINGGVNNDD